MKYDEVIGGLNRILSLEEEFIGELYHTSEAQRLRNVHGKLLKLVREVSRSGDLALIIGVEKTIVAGDLTRYANSKAMVNSLNAALAEIAVIERNSDIVQDSARYRAIDQAHSLPRNRKAELPFDEARQALRSHAARLGNLDKSRLTDEEKQLLDARKAAIFAAEKCYIERQQNALRLEAPAQ